MHQQFNIQQFYILPRTGSLNQAVCASSLKGQIGGNYGYKLIYVLQ